MRNNAAEKLLGTARTEGLAITEDGFADFMDQSDPLREHREAYYFPKRRDGGDCIYLCANALGLQHKDVESSVTAALKKWRDLAVLGNYQHPQPWVELDSIGRKELATIVGAQESEVITMNSHTVNLHLMLVAFFKPKGKRRKIMMETQSFPGNTHAIVSQLETRGMSATEDIIYVSAPNREGWEGNPVPIPTEQFLSIIEKRGDEIAVLLLSAVQFLTGQLFDIPTIAKAARAKGIFVGIDCAHAVGNVPLKLHDWDIDFAYWCTYKYLGSGPGNLGGAFVHSRHTLAGNELKPLRGWWGHERRNRNSLHRSFDPAEGAAGFQLSNTAVLGMAAMLPSVRLISAIGMSPLREKSLLLTSYMELLLSELVPAGALEVITPVDPQQRGAQLSLRILPNKLSAAVLEREAEALEDDEGGDAALVGRCLRSRGVLIEAHPPDILCLAPAPLYNSFLDVLHTARAIAECFA